MGNFGIKSFSSESSQKNLAKKFSYFIINHVMGGSQQDKRREREISHRPTTSLWRVVFLSTTHKITACRWIMANSLVSDWLEQKGARGIVFGGCQGKLGVHLLILSAALPLPAKTQKEPPLLLTHRSQRRKGKAQNRRLLVFAGTRQQFFDAIVLLLTLI